MSNKIKCQVCNKKDAVWCYMPGHSNGIDMFCDDCVPRGCSCNVYSIAEFPLKGDDNTNYVFWSADIDDCSNKRNDNSFYYEPVDEKGRRYPCCEYFYDEDGFEK